MARKPPGYWDDWNNVEEALRPVITRLGRFPTQSEVRELSGGSSISDAIVRAGGYRKVAEQLGTKKGSSKKPNGYWRKWENVEVELKRHVAEHGRMLSRKEMNTLGLSSLDQAIVDYHGGVTAVCRRLGIKPHSQPNGYWRVWENVRQTLSQLIDKLGRFPDRSEYSLPEHRTLMSGVNRYHGGVERVRKRMGFGTLTQPALKRYADQVAEAFMSDPGGAVSFEDFLADLERECRYERDLRVRLGLSPEPESEPDTTESA